jgi:hypothetical protein
MPSVKSSGWRIQTGVKAPRANKNKGERLAPLLYITLTSLPQTYMITPIEKWKTLNTTPYRDVYYMATFLIRGV